MTNKINVPSSKSYMNRALILAALREGETRLLNILDCDDSRNLINALRELGVLIEQKNSTEIVIQGSGGRFAKPSKTLDIGLAGTAMRFLTPILATQPFTSIITGNKRMQERPMKDLIEALTSIGFDIESNDYCPPLIVHGDPSIKPQKIEISSEISSQYISAIMLASPLLGNPEIIITRQTVSEPYIEMTKSMIENFASPYAIETDASSASYFFALGALGFDVKVLNLTRKSLQADILALDYMAKMGCRVIEDQEGIQVIGPKELKPLGNVDLKELPDSAMTLATLCCFANGQSTLTGLHNLRYKETDRLAALSKELSKTGAKVREAEDGLIIHGRNDLHGATIETYDDHRMAMCAAVLKSRIPEIEIAGPQCVSKTYKNFWEDFQKATS
ncbi:3-phosphoshikimate 1-carboxyvinyltransferase [Candidatus Peregrinibacteria bacterium CG22_combo_CG10-13_8_21_14_all_44_10]|nr:MAG: 3-phosphoshikimate 1-carboxyvinyltransferase [Candidatus Peregrinibacteria bacterium CG2_30_44_17]PIP66368.1 MAG: 3-phosphoshikimate 1-carboxyvinyltransferase [Candidatus Peregrinibacteria bacterium CG22_combo_CG10-13_8_21_14_all_44_10]PIS04144.1 MAG: 3-phosphoshikimate 1-carboxyvinyltransferase [Candidatus Peregrinibacteria bacterium CG10_big_fil_rev_8_21_14_0_10_44_7]PIX79222.1 MAG: 3-phosphoshikimate 1-carboxyvinyltransferase [Candidatus Peregrinibacteria bacterium CG_4_10_14_3_um_fil